MKSYTDGLGRSFDYLTYRYFELSNETSNKFWELRILKQTAGFTDHEARKPWHVELRWGKIGVGGNVVRHGFVSQAKAEVYGESRVRDKVKKGYVLMSTDPPDEQQVMQIAQTAVAAVSTDWDLL